MARTRGNSTAVSGTLKGRGDFNQIECEGKSRTQEVLSISRFLGLLRWNPACRWGVSFGWGAQGSCVMAPRANWKGYLKLSLVSCSVALFPATTTRERVRFNIINRETGHRVRYEVVDAETGEEVPQEDRVKGYKVGGDNYVLLEEDELDEVALESTHTIEIESFVPRQEVDELYLDEFYYLVPDDKVGYEAFAVIRDENDYFDDIPDVKVSKDMLELAIHILETKKTKFDPSEFEDRYETALHKLIKAKQAGKTPPTAPSPQPSNVINLMDALRRSVQAERGGASGTARRTKGARKRAAPKRAASKRKKL